MFHVLNLDNIDNPIPISNRKVIFNNLWDWHGSSVQIKPRFVGEKTIEGLLKGISLILKDFFSLGQFIRRFYSRIGVT